KALYFQEGQDVRKGEILFEIDPEPLQAQVAELEANISRDLALAKQARATVLKDEAQLKTARSQAERSGQLSREGIISKEQTETTVTTADTAAGLLAADQAAVESADAAAKADRARLAQTRLQLSYTKIPAPISGRAGAVLVRPGNLVKENDASLVTLLQVTPVFVTFSVPEQFLAEVRRDQAGRALDVVAKSASGASASGVLRFIDNSVDAASGTIKLKAEFRNENRQLWPGSFATVRAKLKDEPGRVVVLAKTVQTGPAGKYVWVLGSGDKVSMRPVGVARAYVAADGLEYSVIASGLASGERVISEGQMRLGPGAAVRILS
ncbi:MAG: efflux RND transporter periplasmic adaptor subunit, partial [Acidobacteriota bacterium]|nr:efflux RND transporter periplasmic adaptor subunit [Acidobacteriota bacterium]